MTPDDKNACGCSICNPNAWWMVVCDLCGNKRCPHASNHDFRCTKSNVPNQIGERILPDDYYEKLTKEFDESLAQISDEELIKEFGENYKTNAKCLFNEMATYPKEDVFLAMIKWMKATGCGQYKFRKVVFLRDRILKP